ncbi:hypothetical protein GQ457_10G000770 [Hibiscus cannabinus]
MVAGRDSCLDAGIPPCSRSFRSLRERSFLKANSVSLGCLRSITVGLPGYNNVGASTVAPLKRSGTNLIFNYHRKNNADLRKSKERKLGPTGLDICFAHVVRPNPKMDWILTPTGPAQVIQEPKENPRFADSVHSVDRPCSEGSMKFSIVGLVLANRFGSGGVLASNFGVFRALFSGPAPVSGVVFAELLAVKLALKTFIEAGLFDLVELVVESRSKVALNWINNPLQRPWLWWRILAEIDILVCRIKRVRFSFLSESGSATAVWLAKDGVRRSELFKSWW